MPPIPTEAMEIGVEVKRLIKLRCPSVSSSKIVEIEAFEDEKLDLGLISRIFGLHPNSLKLNGHFISRGIDLVASSVTWRSLIGFFSSRGFSTGASNSDALVVHGKLNKIGSKRIHGPSENETSGIMNEQGECNRDKKKLQLEYGRMPTHSERPDCLDLKRKLCFKNEIHPKRSKYNECVSSGSNDWKCGASMNNKSSCSLLSRSMKRMRVDEIATITPLKKIR